MNGRCITGSLCLLLTWGCARRAEVDVGPPGPMVTSDPPGLEIVLDGRRLGRTTPARIESWEKILPHEIQLDMPGRVPFRQEIPAGDPPAEVHARLPVAAFVDIATDPPGATISIAGQSFANAPAKLAVPATEAQQLTVSLDGYLPESTTVSSPVGETAQWRVSLKRAGTADLESDPQGAQASLDGVAVGRTPVQVPVEVGKSHRARLSLKGLTPCDRTFKVAWKAIEHVSCDLDDEVGRKLKAKLTATETELKYSQKRLEGYDAPQGNYMNAMAADRARGKLEDHIQQLTELEDQQQGDLEAHRTELQERFEKKAVGTTP